MAVNWPSLLSKSYGHEQYDFEFDLGLRGSIRSVYRVQISFAVIQDLETFVNSGSCGNMDLAFALLFRSAARKSFWSEGKHSSLFSPGERR